MSATLAFLGEFGDAIEFIFNARESQAGGAQVGGAENLPLLWTHLQASTAAAMALAIADRAAARPRARPHRPRRVRSRSRSRTSAARCPSVALIAFFVAFFPRHAGSERHLRARAAGDPADPHQHLRRRAPGRPRHGRRRARHGHVGAQIVRQVELPLALPLIFGGIRTSTVNVVATATSRRWSACVTLGDPIISGNATAREGQLGAAIVVAALAVPSSSASPPLQRAVTPAGLKLERRRPHAASPRNPQEEDPDRPMKLTTHPARAARGARARASSPRAATTTTRRRGRRRPPTRRGQPSGKIASKQPTPTPKVDDHRRLEELHRAVHPRRDLRAGARGRGLQGQEGAQPRRRADRLQGAQGRRDRRLPGVHRHGADCRSSASQGRRSRRTRRQAYEQAKAGFEKEGITALAPTPFTSLQRGRGDAGDGREARHSRRSPTSRARRRT